MDVMLQEADEGGELVVNGRAVPRFKAGDAAVFVSAAVHGVRPVTRGRRRVLVVELWDGPERRCGHRCERTEGEDCADVT